MPNDVTPFPSVTIPAKCAVDDCVHPVAEGRDDYCTVHATESEAIDLAVFVKTQVEVLDGDLVEAIRAARLLLESLIVLGMHRGLLARLRAVG